DQIHRPVLKGTGAVLLVKVKKVSAQLVLQPQEIFNLAITPISWIEADHPGTHAVWPSRLLRTKRALSQPHDFLQQCFRQVHVSPGAARCPDEHWQGQAAGVTNQQSNDNRRSTRCRRRSRRPTEK